MKIKMVFDLTTLKYHTPGIFTVMDMNCAMMRWGKKFDKQGPKKILIGQLEFREMQGWAWTISYKKGITAEEIKNGSGWTTDIEFHRNLAKGKFNLWRGLYGNIDIIEIDKPSYLEFLE